MASPRNGRQGRDARGAQVEPGGGRDARRYDNRNRSHRCGSKSRSVADRIPQPRFLYAIPQVHSRPLVCPDGSIPARLQDWDVQPASAEFPPDGTRDGGDTASLGPTELLYALSCLARAVSRAEKTANVGRGPRTSRSERTFSNSRAIVASGDSAL